MRLKIMFGAVVLSIALFAALSPAAEKTVTVKGYVIDSACTFTKNLGKPISKECATNCANAGSMLVILADDGTIYWPIADSMPATGSSMACGSPITMPRTPMPWFGSSRSSS